jgi:hypothetical protein
MHEAVTISFPHGFIVTNVEPISAIALRMTPLWRARAGCLAKIEVIGGTPKGKSQARRELRFLGDKATKIRLWTSGSRVDPLLVVEASIVVFTD